MNIEKIIEIYAPNQSVDVVRLSKALQNAKPIIGASFPDFVNYCGCRSQFANFVETLDYADCTYMRNFYPEYFDSSGIDFVIEDKQRLANHIYAYVGGNGNPISNDGWTYRRRGALLSLCGRLQYNRCSQDLYCNSDLMLIPEVVEFVEDAINVAVWFWNKYQCSSFCKNVEKMYKCLTQQNSYKVDVEYVQTKYDQLMSVL